MAGAAEGGQSVPLDQGAGKSKLEAHEAFANLFRGYEQRYGRFEITGKKTSGKIEGIAKTVDAPPVAALYLEHIMGAAGLGIIPLTEDDKCYFAAIDVDKYDMSLADLAKRIERLPLVLTESKSGGAHLWLFIKDGAPARLVVEVLKLWAGELGFGGCEIFPKQTERASPNDVGNWINLPYFGGKRQYVTPDGVRHPIETFLDVVYGNETTPGRRVTEQWLEVCFGVQN